MRFRPVWIAVPACAAAGAVTYSMVGAQEAPPAGFYPARTSPHPTVIAEQNAQSAYIRPLNEPQTQPGQPPANWLPAAGANVPARLAASPSNAPPPPKPRLTQPVVSGPLPADGPISQVSATAPPAAPKTGRQPQTGGSPPVIRPAGGVDLPPPSLTPVVPTLTPTPVPAPSLTAPLPPPAAPSLPPPRVTLEPGDPVKPSEPPSKPPELVKSPEPRPLPAINPPAAPAVPPPAPGGGTLSPVQPPAHAGGSSQNMASGFPATPLSPRQAPNVVVECVAPEMIGVGQPLTYELVVRNAGVSPVANVRVEDELPAGAKFLSAEPAGDQDGNRLTWAIGMLDAGVERRIKVTVKPADEGELRSRAVVTFATAAEARVRVTRPRVQVALLAAEAARVGDEVPFQIKVSNTGSGPAGKLLVQARLTDGLHHPQGGVIEAELANLPPGESKTITLRVTATKAGSQNCSIAAAADGNAAETAKAVLNVVEPRLEARLLGPAKCLVRGEPVFTLEMANPGTAGTDPVQAWAVVPDGFEFVSATDGGSFNPANRTVSWKLAGLPAGAGKAVAVKLRAATPVEGTLKIVAQAVPAAAADGVQTAGFRPGNVGRVLEAKADAPVKAEGVPALRFEVADVEDPVEVGKEAVYEIKVMNQGTGPCTNVQVVATLADGTTVTAASGQTRGQGQGQQVVFEPIAALDTKKEAVFQVRVKGGQPGDTRFRVQVTCDQFKTPIAKEENTRFYKE